MGRQIHFELFVRRGSSRGWSLIDAIDRRDDAIAAAKAQMASGFVTGVKVVREVYDDETGGFLSIDIYEDGHRKLNRARETDDAPPVLPCLTPEDFYAAHARQALARLFADTLARWRLTVTELTHRADMLEKLEATGTLFQHAVQKVAVAQASTPGAPPVVQIVRALTDLADRAIRRVYKEERSGRIVACANAAELAAFAEARAAAPDAAFIIGMAFAKFLARAPDWPAKLDAVLAVLETPPQNDAAAKIIAALADSVVAEIVSAASALQALLGPMPDLGAALVAMSDLYLGRMPQAGSPLARLAALFGKDRLLDARTAIARRVLAELKTHRKLGPDVETELGHLRAITQRLVLGPPRLVSHDDIVAAVTLRSRHLVQAGPIGEYLAPVTGALDKADRLLTFEENIVGAENKRRLWDFLIPILTGAAFDDALIAERAHPLNQLARAAALQTRVVKSTLPETARAEAAALIDAAALRTLDLPRLTAALADPAKGPAIAAALTKAVAAGATPKGQCERALAALLKPKAAA